MTNTTIFKDLLDQLSPPSMSSNAIWFAKMHVWSATTTLNLFCNQKTKNFSWTRRNSSEISTHITISQSSLKNSTHLLKVVWVTSKEISQDHSSTFTAQKTNNTHCWPQFVMFLNLLVLLHLEKFRST